MSCECLDTVRCMAHDGPMPSQPDPLVATPEAMEILGYKNASSVARLVYEHKLVPARKMPGKNGAYLFHRVDLERIAADRAERAAS